MGHPVPSTLLDQRQRTVLGPGWPVGCGDGCVVGFESVSWGWLFAVGSKLPGGCAVLGRIIRRVGHCGVSLRSEGIQGPVLELRAGCPAGGWPVVHARPNGKGRDAVIESSIPAVLEGRARRQPNDVAYTFIDYEVDPAGFAESLTWSQVYQRAGVVAEELAVCGSAGDRARYWLRRGWTTSSPSSAHSGRFHRRAAFGAAIRHARRTGVRGAAGCVAGRHTDDVRGRRRGHALRRRAAGRSVPLRAWSRSTRWTWIRRRSSARAVVRITKAGLSAVHVGVDASARRCGGLAPQCRRQSRTGDVRLLRGYGGATAGHHRGVVAALLSRHGLFFGICGTDHGGLRRCAVEPDGVSAETGAVDAAAGAVSPFILRRTEFRVRTGGTTNVGR